MSVRIIMLSCLVLATSLVQAQQAAPPSSTIDLHVVVTPKSGPPVADLQQSDFTILDNNKAQPITSFSAAGAQDPVRVVLVIDEVNVPYNSIAYQRGQIARFLRANGGQLPRPTQLAFFTDKGMQIQEGFSTDGNELNTSLSQHTVALREIRRSSQYELSDLLNLSLTGLRDLSAHEAALPGRKMILWISPGWPLLSGPRVQLDSKQQNGIFASVVQLTTGFRQAHITLYAVNPLGAEEGVARSNYYENFLKGVSKPGQVDLADLSLQVLAVHSGGLNLYGSNDLAALLQQCMADTRASYNLSFKAAPAEHRDDYHHVEVKLDKPGLIARTTQGYYAQP